MREGEGGREGGGGREEGRGGGMEGVRKGKYVHSSDRV